MSILSYLSNADHHITKVSAMDVQTETAKATFNVSVGFTAFGFTLNEWVALITIIYMLMQMILLIPKFFALRQKRKDEKNEH